MAEWEKQKIELDKNGIYCSFGSYINTNDFSLYITRANGKSLIDYFYKKEFLKILNEVIEENFESFDDFLNANNFKIKENELGKYIVLRDLKELERQNDFNITSYKCSFPFIAKVILKCLVISLAFYLKCKAIYSNNEIIGLGKDFNQTSLDFKCSNNKNLIKQIVEEIYQKKLENETDDNSFNLDFSNTYKKIKANTGMLGKTFNEFGNIYKIRNDENPAFLQKQGKINFLTNGYYYIDKKNNKTMVNIFKIVSDEKTNIDSNDETIVKKIKNYFSKGVIEDEEKKQLKKISNTNISCYSGIVEDTFGIFFNFQGSLKANQKKLFSYLETTEFLKILNKDFKVPFKSFKEFLDINNFAIIENENFKYIEVLKIKRNSKGKAINYVKGFSSYIDLISLFLISKLNEYLTKHFENYLFNSFDKMYTNEGSKIKILFNEKVKKNNKENPELKLKSTNIFEEIYREKDNEMVVNTERISTILKSNNNHIETIKFVCTNTYITLEKITRENIIQNNLEIEVIKSEENTAQLLSRELIKIEEVK
jgi:hypothetical protein